MIRSNKSLKSTLILLLLLPLLVLAVKTVLDIRKGAAGVAANIVINSGSAMGSSPTSLWQNLSQGGEEPADMIRPVIAQIRSLQPELIRVDHLFDYYQVYKGPGSYDFSRLDQVVNSILLTGARPMLSLSYTTADMSSNGQNAGEPRDWNQWYQLVKATAARYSVEKGISGIYYEVWNEPDLFGGWKYNRSPNYTTLYTQTARAVAEGAGSASYKVGGPAITALYVNWIKALFATASQNNLRLDFVSWHRYSKDLDDFEKDVDTINKVISSYPRYSNIERIITEVGPNSEPDPWYDSSLSGAHLIAMSTRLSGKIHRAFTFEPVDGPTSRSSNSLGWGLISHSTKGSRAKPRFYALQFLNSLSGRQIAATGSGSWVSALAAKSGSTIQILLVNYDPRNTHAETFPLTVQNLRPGSYELKTTDYLGRASTRKVVATANFRDVIFMEANTAKFLELSPL